MRIDDVFCCYSNTVKQENNKTIEGHKSDDPETSFPNPHFVDYMTPTKDTLTKVLKLDVNKIKKITKILTAPTGSNLIGNLLVFDSPSASDSEHTCHPSPKTPLRTNL